MCLNLCGLSKAQKIRGKGLTRRALACKQALHLRNIVKSSRTKDAREETRKQGAGGFAARSRGSLLSLKYESLFTGQARSCLSSSGGSFSQPLSHSSKYILLSRKPVSLVLKWHKSCGKCFPCHYSACFNYLFGTVTASLGCLCPSSLAWPNRKKPHFVIFVVNGETETV